MQNDRRQGLRSAVLVWVIGMALGIAAGALTAQLLIPSRGLERPPEGGSLRDRIFGE